VHSPKQRAQKPIDICIEFADPRPAPTWSRRAVSRSVPYNNTMKRDLTRLPLPVSLSQTPAPHRYSGRCYRSLMLARAISYLAHASWTRNCRSAVNFVRVSSVSNDTEHEPLQNEAICCNQCNAVGRCMFQRRGPPSPTSLICPPRDASEQGQRSGRIRLRYRGLPLWATIHARNTATAGA